MSDKVELEIFDWPEKKKCYEHKLDLGKLIESSRTEHVYGRNREPLQDPSFVIKFLEDEGYLTGTYRFYGKGNDRDYVVSFDALYEHKDHPDISKISNGIEGYVRNTDRLGLKRKHGFGCYKFEFDGIKYDVIVVNDSEFHIWKAATDIMAKTIMVLDLPAWDKDRRVTIFEALKSAARVPASQKKDKSIPKKRSTQGYRRYPSHRGWESTVEGAEVRAACLPKCCDTSQPRLSTLPLMDGHTKAQVSCQRCGLLVKASLKDRLPVTMHTAMDRWEEDVNG